MYYFGAVSKGNLKTIHNDLQRILNHAIRYIDFSVIEGQRTQQRQMELFANGKSELDGVGRFSMHQHFPSLAVDIIPYQKGHNPFDVSEKSELMFYQLSRQIFISARELGIKINWGGHWKSLKDFPHWQLA